jgi:hypothetical protein
MGNVEVVAVRCFLPPSNVNRHGVQAYGRRGGCCSYALCTNSNVTGMAHRRMGDVEIVAVRPFVLP